MQKTKLTDQEMVDIFFKNGGQITVCDNNTSDFSEFGGKTRAHLDREDNLKARQKFEPIKHPYEQKKFKILGGNIVTCIKHYARRTRKGSLVNYFRFSDGSNCSLTYITKSLNSGKLILLDKG